jgi:Serpin (serine protease inhibitor)
MSTSPADLTHSQLARAIARYAERLHRRLGEQHHVVSPLGAWLVVALCSSLSSEDKRAALGEVLGAAPQEARAAASDLISTPHPAVGAAAALWVRTTVSTKLASAWRESLPQALETGDLPSQQELNQWAERHTFGLIRQFPLKLDPGTVMVLATALATRVSWEVPFELVDAEVLGASSPWSTSLRKVLSTPANPGSRRPVGGVSHDQFVTATERAGTVAVHIAAAREGLRVTSVIANQDVAPVDVIAAAYDIAWREADQRGSVDRLSLFDLPVSKTPLWDISEEPVQTSSPDGKEERYRTVLPAWSAQTNVDLAGDELGFADATQGVAAAVGLGEYRYAAKQSAVARYSRTGFEAAAVTGLAVALAAFVGHPGRRRTATLHFGHSFAAVAVVAGPPDLGQRFARWEAVPVFSAWVTKPDDASEQ